MANNTAAAGLKSVPFDAATRAFKTVTHSGLLLNVPVAFCGLRYAESSW